MNKALGGAPAILKKIETFLRNDPGVQFAYLFGSHSRGQGGPLSDYDIAVFLDGRLNRFAYRLALIERLSRALKSDRFDLVVLNEAPVLLQYEVVRSGQVLKDRKRKRVDFETRVLSRYLDTEFFRKVQRQYLKAQLGGGVHNG